MRDIIAFLLAIAFAAVLLGGCARVSIESDPAEAAVMYSLTGAAPWQPWPPDADEAEQTPAGLWTRPDPYYYVRVEREGYYPVRPVFVDVGLLRRQAIHFDLEPTPELFAQMQREKGLVLFEGEWVDPNVAGLVEYEGQWMRPEERTRRENLARGLVLYEPENRWVTPAEHEALVAKANLAKGLVPLKGRWWTPAEAQEQEALDREAQRLAATSGTFEIRADRIGPVFTSGSQLQVADLTGRPLEVILSGPVSRRARVEPYNSTTIETEPGTYTLVIREGEAGDDAAAGVGRVRLTPQSRYSATFRGEPSGEPYPIEIPPLDTLPPPVDLRVLKGEAPRAGPVTVRPASDVLGAFDTGGRRPPAMPR